MIFDKTIIPLALVGYEMIIANSALRASLALSGESAHLPPICPGFDSRTRRHMWAEFVGSLLCSERFFYGNSGFSPLLKNQHLIWFNLIYLFDLFIWIDLFDLQSPQLIEHSCSARMNWDLNKVIVIIKLILNCPRAFAITCLSHKGQSSVLRNTFKVLPLHKQVCQLSLKNRLAEEQGMPTTTASKTKQVQFTQSNLYKQNVKRSDIIHLFSEAYDGVRSMKNISKGPNEP